MIATTQTAARSAARSASSMTDTPCFDCVAKAREAVKSAQAFRRSVAEFDKINIDSIFAELKEMRASVMH